MRGTLSCRIRFSGFTWLFFLFFTSFFLWQIVKFGFEIIALLNMHRFFTYLLQVPEVRNRVLPSEPFL